ncbi:polyprenal reductase [Salarias fasciatus]|uniref:Polyprenal reductase n=1 Tax=Salarias fasciatus TaxID=181472 RepID=A0A672HLK5_SALFA|nr:polyprenol reductase [Salarias fasciatus]
MFWSSVGFIDILWGFLAFCFFAAFCAHKISALQPKRYEKFSVYMLFQDLIRYGKTKQSLKREKWLRVFDVPKRWFWHFYAISVCWNGFLLALTLNARFDNHSYPSWLTAILDRMTAASSSHGQVPQLSTVLVQLLLCIHSLRRLLECLFVSVFSDGAMHLVQYLFGLGYYIVLGLTVLCSDPAGQGRETQLADLNFLHLAGLVLFLWASKLQHQSIALLARLRTGQSGSVETLDHKVPKGGWFEWVSCPHYFAELLIYISLSLISGGLSFTLWLAVLYVFFNQALAGQLCHEHYVSKYDSYPKHRRAFIPFLL